MPTTPAPSFRPLTAPTYLAAFLATLLAALFATSCSGSGGDDPDLSGPVAPPVGQRDPVPLLALTDRGAAIVDASTGAVDPITGAGLASAFGIESLARDPSSGALFAVDRDIAAPADAGDARLVALDPASGAAGELSYLDRNDIDALTWDADAGELIGLSGTTGELVRIAPDAESVEAIGTLPAGSTPAIGLARDPVSGTLYVFDAANAALLAVDPVTAATTSVGPTGVATISGLAWDTAADRLVGVSALDGTVLAIDTASGAATAIAALVAPDATDVRGLCFDADAGTLIANDNMRDTLATIDLVSGQWTPFGQTGLRSIGGMSRRTDGTLVVCERRSGAIAAIVPGVEGFALLGFSGTHELAGLAVHPVDERIFVVDVDADVLIEFDAAVGPTLVGSLGVDRIEGLTFDPAGSALHGVGYDTDLLYTIDTSTAATVVAGSLPPSTKGVAISWFDPLDLPYVLRENGSGMVSRNDLGPPTPILGLPAVTGARGAVLTDGGDTVLLARFGVDDILAAGVFDQALSGLAGLGFAQPVALTEATSIGTLLAIESASNRLIEIDPTSGVGTSQSSLALGAIRALEYDSTSSVAWVWSFGLYAYSPGSGIAQQVGATVPTQLQDLAYDPNADVLYGVTAGPAPQLVTVTRSDGSLVTIGTIGSAAIEALGFDAETDTLVGYESEGRVLIEIDPGTAGRTELATSEQPLRALGARYER